ncbi:GNAT family N-acetyltransferase, partial [candidate division WOR-3 bacterium]|nr:GNAT family N-acetyltransferase [candidate division WOR-3 bacterium]
MPGLIERIRGVFRPVREPFAPLGLGPSISDPDARHSSFAIASGPLDGTRLRLDAVVQPRSADFSLFPAPRPSSGRLTPDTSHPTSEASDTRDSPLAHCHYDRDPNGNEVLWDIVVHPGHRGRGLAALLVRLSLRRLLLAGRGRAWL